MSEFDIGFLGGGQLARMSIQAAQRMGLRCLSHDPSQDSPASQIAPAIVGALDDPERVAEVFRRCGVVTLENEFIPGAAIREALRLSGVEESRLTPGVETLETIQDKLKQREALQRASVPSPRAIPIEPEAGAESAGAKLGYPLVLKARFGGYDGKGTRYAKTPQELEEHRALWIHGNWMAEEFVPFKRELACMVYRSRTTTGSFPTMETVQKNHVCNLVFPANADATDIAIAAVEAVNGYGLFGVEMFELGDGEVLINELAPRPHNTGHYTLDWGGVSQFEQHVRLVMNYRTDLPVGLDTCMANLLGRKGLGDFRKGIKAALRHPQTHVHWYGKAEAKPGRKMGHLNCVGEGAVERALLARDDFYAVAAEAED
jgi:5-(carboxyamino)imidazole ribonucleotide synthase